MSQASLSRRSLLSAIAAGALLPGGASAQLFSPLAPQVQDSGVARLVRNPTGRPVDRSLTFQDAEGSEISLGAYRGRGLVVNFWATWCPPCVYEMPALDRAREAMLQDGIEVLALSSDRGGRSVVEPFYQRAGLRHLGILLDQNSAVSRAFGTRGVPTTAIIDRRGLEVARLLGIAQWDHTEMLAEIRRLVGPPLLVPNG